MARLSLTTRKRKRKLIRVFFMQAMTIVSSFFMMVCTLIAKYKRRSDGLIEGINNSAITLGNSLIQASKTMVQAELDLQKKTSMVFSEILKMDSLSGSEKFKAFRKIAREPSDVLTFWGLAEKRRENWVRFMLEE